MINRISLTRFTTTENTLLNNDIEKTQYQSIGHEDWDNNEAW